MAKMTMARSTAECARRPALPEEEETEQDERNLDRRVREQENVENAPRVFAEDLDEMFQRGMIFLESPQLMRL